MEELLGPSSANNQSDTHNFESQKDEICFLTQKFVDEDSHVNYMSDNFSQSATRQDLDTNFDRGLVDYNNTKHNLNSNFLNDISHVKKLLDSAKSSTQTKSTLKSNFSQSSQDIGDGNTFLREQLRNMADP